MRIIAILLRILIIAVWIKMMSLSWWTPDTAPFCSWVWFIALGLYLALQAIKGPKAMLCPLFHGCKIDESCK